jgi:transketolase
MPSAQELQDVATQARRDVLRMTHSAQSGHPGGSLGCADFLAALYFHFMKHNPENFQMEGKGEDVFILSNGHISPVLYSLLARIGYFEKEELKTFRKINSRLQGHPATAEGLPGIRVATGSLGQGISVALGIALSKRLEDDDRLVFSLHGDGELQEGQNWEAFMFAAYHNVDNIIATIDYNGQQIDGPTDEVLSLGDLEAKFDSFGWDTLTMDGNDMENVLEKLEEAQERTGNGKPVAILMKTHMGYPVDFMLDKYELHGQPPDDEELEKALAQLEETLGDY